MLCVQSSPHLLVVWRPDLHTYTAHITSKVNGSAAVTAKMNNVDLPKVVVQGLGKAIQLWQEDVHVSIFLHRSGFWSVAFSSHPVLWA